MNKVIVSVFCFAWGFILSYLGGCLADYLSIKKSKITIKFKKGFTIKDCMEAKNVIDKIIELKENQVVKKSLKSKKK